MHEFDREGLGKGLGATSSENDRRRFRGAPACELLRKPPQILNQDDLQRYRDRPKLADREGLNVLIRVDVGNQDVGIKTAVGVRDERPRHAEHAGVASERTRDELWELAIVAR